MKYLVFVLMVFALTFAFVPDQALLHAQIDDDEDGRIAPGGDDDGRITPGGDGNGSATLDNPLQSDSLIGFFQAILDVLLIFAVPIIVFFIIFAGFKYVMARGNPGEIATANKALLYAVIGGVLILGAEVLLAVIEGTIAAF